MKDKEIPRYKMTDALPEAPAETPGHPEPERPGQSPHEPKPAEIRQQNAQVQPDPKDRLVDIGRGEQTAGRQQ